MTELRDNIFAIEVPPDAHQFHVMNFGKPPTLSYDYSVVKSGAGSAGLTAMENLPPGSYEIMFTTKKVSEEDAKKVVGKEGVHPSWPFNPLYTNYGNDRAYIDDARKSLQSLLKSKGLSAENYLIIKKVV